MCRRKESTISIPVLAERCSATKTLTHNSATAPGLSEVRTQRNFFQYGGCSRNKMALRFAYGQLTLGSTINVSEVMTLRKLAQARPTMPCIPLVIMHSLGIFWTADRILSDACNRHLRETFTE